MSIKKIEVNFSSKSNEYTAKQLNSQVCKNWYSIIDESGKFHNPLMPFPGSKPYSLNPDAKNVRGIKSINKVMYAVVDNEFRIYNDHGDWIVAGTLNSNLGLVKFLSSETQIFISDARDGYVYQLVETILHKKGEFFRLQETSTFITIPIFRGTGLDDMSSLGTYTGLGFKIFSISIDSQGSPTITPAIFIGSGLNDLMVSGTFTGTTIRNFVVKIDGNAELNTFTWSLDGGTTWSGVFLRLQTTDILLAEGVLIRFSNTKGHTLGSEWRFVAHNGTGNDDTFSWNNGEGIAHEKVPITGLDQLLSEGVEVKFLNKTGHTVGDTWVFDAEIGDSFFAPTTPMYLNGYGIFIKPNTQRFYITRNGEFSVIDPLDYGSTNDNPDYIVAGAIVNQEIIFINLHTTEFYYNTGASPFPIQKRQGMTLNWGTKAPYSVVVSSNNNVFWLAQTESGGRVVVMLINYQIQIISNQALNDIIQNYEKIDDAEGLIMEWNGKTFYFLTFPTHDVTWVFDFDAKIWRQRTSIRKIESIRKKDYVEGRYLASCHVYHNGQHYIGDYRSGNIYRLDAEYGKDNDMPIINEVVTAPLNINLNNIVVHSLEIDFERSKIDIVGEGSNPMAMLQYSKDGGLSWGKEIWRPIGKTGEYKGRTKWNKIGYGSNIVFKLRISDPVYKVLIGAVIEIEVLNQ